MNKQFSKYINTIKPIFIFLILLISTHFIWKVAIDADINSNQIAICGYDASPFFYKISVIIAKVIHWMLQQVAGIKSILSDTIVIASDNPNARGIRVLWSCTGIKQLYMFITIFLIYPGPNRVKCWYIPLGCFILILYNLFRISIIAIKTANNGTSFDYWHDLFNYPVYMIIFLLWIVWEEKYNKVEKSMIAKLNRKEKV